MICNAGILKVQDLSWVSSRDIFTAANRPSAMKQVIIARRDLGMGRGKLAAQVAHASLSAYEKADDRTQRRWQSNGQQKVVLRADDERTLHELAGQARRAGLPVALIRDAGHTQLDPGTVTALGIGPASANDIDPITGDLSLL